MAMLDVCGFNTFCIAIYLNHSSAFIKLPKTWDWLAPNKSTALYSIDGLLDIIEDISDFEVPSTTELYCDVIVELVGVGPFTGIGVLKGTDTVLFCLTTVSTLFTNGIVDLELFQGEFKLYALDTLFISIFTSPPLHYTTSGVYYKDD